MQGTVLRAKAYLFNLLVIKREELFLRTNRRLLCKIDSRFPHGAKSRKSSSLSCNYPLAFLVNPQQPCIYSYNRQKTNSPGANRNIIFTSCARVTYQCSSHQSSTLSVYSNASHDRLSEDYLVCLFRSMQELFELFRWEYFFLLSS